MAIVERTMYVAKCDHCGKLDDDGDYCAWIDEASAFDAATDQERGNWRTQDGGQLYCFECRVSEGDLRDDDEPDKAD